MNHLRRAVITGPLCGLLVACACFIASAWADEAGDKAAAYVAAAGNEADAYSDCTADYGRARAQSQKTPEQIADEAIKACEPKAGAVKVALMGPKLKLPEAEADATVATVTEALRENLIELIKKDRGE